MAGLISTGIWGFICSMLPTGNRDEKGRMIMREHFMSGFTGWGWKIWKTVAGFFRLEIDELVVRRTMVVFELLIQKIRAINGAMAITQGNGKIKSVEPSEDGLYYLITLEEEHMSFVEYDFMRCQEFTGEQKFYHVEIASVEGGIIRVPVSEFEGSIPSPGDEVVQFGNSSRDEKYSGRHSAIYLHADASGQPAIDVLFDIYSKDWEGCTKVKVGGDIPGTNGLRGLYCENGMIKGVDSTGRTMYCIYPNGSAMFGDGSAQFNKDRSGHLAGGAIAWQWDEAKKKYMCTMGDVVLTWDNLSDEVKENLKGEPGEPGVSVPGAPGVDANLLPWVQQWDNNKTLIGSEYVVSPKMFSGTKSTDGKLTGIAQGRDCISIDGIKRTGIFAIVDDEVVFELDPMTKKYVFKGDVYADKGVFKGGIQSKALQIELNAAYASSRIDINVSENNSYQVIVLDVENTNSNYDYVLNLPGSTDYIGVELTINFQVVSSRATTFNLYVKPVAEGDNRMPFILWQNKSVARVTMKRNCMLKMRAIPRYSAAYAPGKPQTARPLWMDTCDWVVINSADYNGNESGVSPVGY